MRILLLHVATIRRTTDTHYRHIPLHFSHNERNPVQISLQYLHCRGSVASGTPCTTVFRDRSWVYSVPLNINFGTVNKWGYNRFLPYFSRFTTEDCPYQNSSQVQIRHHKQVRHERNTQGSRYGDMYLGSTTSDAISMSLQQPGNRG